jgi:DNA-binding LacI/PurR family transcriptional regulator
MVDTSTLRSIAERAECAPASVLRYLAGAPMRGLTQQRIARAVAELGLATIAPLAVSSAAQPMAISSASRGMR